MTSQWGWGGRRARRDRGGSTSPSLPYGWIALLAVGSSLATGCSGPLTNSVVEKQTSDAGARVAASAPPVQAMLKVENTAVFNYIGREQSYTPPSNANSFIIQAAGASGGGGHSAWLGDNDVFHFGVSLKQPPPAPGALVTTTIPFSTAPPPLNVNVGGVGTCSTAGWIVVTPTSPLPGGAGGWNGGGNGGVSTDQDVLGGYANAGVQSGGGCGGGGASDVQINPVYNGGTTANAALVVAGGGGGVGGSTAAGFRSGLEDWSIGGQGGSGGGVSSTTVGNDATINNSLPTSVTGIISGSGAQLNGVGGSHYSQGGSGTQPNSPGTAGGQGGVGGNPTELASGGGGGGGGYVGGGGGGGGYGTAHNPTPLGLVPGYEAPAGGGGGGGGQSFVAASAVSSSVSAAPNDLKSFPYGQNGSVSITPVSSSITVSGSTSSSPVALQPVTGSVTATGGSGPYQYTAFGTGWPEGVGITADGQLQGTPTLPGQYTLSVIATDSTGTNGYGTVPLTVSPATFSSTGMPAATAGVDYDQPLPLNGTYGSGLTWTTTGLPAGVTVNTDGHLTGKFPQTGGQTFTAVGTNSSGQQITVNQTFTITVNPFTISTTSLPQACLGFPYDSQLTFNGGTPPFTWNANTPAGLTITNTGLIQGTPTTDGTSTMTLTATDANGVTGSPATLQLDTECGPNTLNITTPQSAFPEVRTYHNQPHIDVQMTAANNTGTLTWSLDSGALPDGVTITSTGKVSGTILDEEPNTWTFTIKTTDTNGKWALHTYNIIGFSDPQPTTTPTTPHNASRDVPRGAEPSHKP